VGRISEEDVRRVRDATDLVALVSERVVLKQKGRLYWGCCPFHAEKTPSFNVHPAKQIFKCFGCGKGGDVSIDVKDSSGKTAHVNAGATGTVSLPATFPKDVPVPKDSTVAVSVAQGAELMVSFRVKGTVPESVAFYQERL
jgi:hypothetical protein